MNYDQLIKNWHTKAADEDYFSKFVFEYLAFIAFLKRKKFTDEDRDWKAIRRLKNDLDVKNRYLETINANQHIREAWNLIIDELNRRPLGSVDENTDEVDTIIYWSCSCQNVQNRKQHICEEQGRIRNLQDWENMVEFWHSIRNNLFHGAKNPQDARDQLIIENGYKTLRSLMEILLTQGGI